MIRLRVDNSGKGLTPLNLNWWQPTKREWTPVLLDDHPQFWKQQVDPTYKRPWAQLTPRYANWKGQRYPGQPILRATGLMQDLAYIYTKGNVFYVKSTDYGAYQQNGTSKMVARPWMGVPDISLQQIVPISWRNILSRKR
jgi:phage gpG-like protein